MMTVLQFAENLTDRQAADAVRGRLDWKYCLGLALEDEGFDFSVLSEFRARLVAGGLERAVLDLLLGRLKGLGLVRAGGRQRTDSTHVLAAIRGMNRVELAEETVRAALEALAAAAPDWLAGVIDASWQQVYGQRIDTLRLPASETARSKLAEQYGRDGYHLLEAVRAPGAPGWLRELPAVRALRMIWVQQYYRSTDEHGEKVIRREASKHGVPPGRLKLVSPYDPDARYSEKRGKGWAGYRVHISETCQEPEPDGTREAPNLITSVAATEATVPGAAMTEPVHDMLEASGLTPGEHAVDSGYTFAELLLDARARGITLLGPLLSASPPQARSGGYTAEMFTIDWDHQQVTCPQDATSTGWSQVQQGKGRRSWSGSPPPPAGPARPGHHIPHLPPAVPAPPRDPRGRRGRPGRAGQPALETPVQHPRRGRGHHAAGHPRHRHPSSPLPRPGQDPHGTRRRRGRGQPDPAGCLVDRQAPRPDPDHPPPAAQPHRHLSQISQQVRSPSDRARHGLGLLICRHLRGFRVHSDPFALSGWPHLPVPVRSEHCSRVGLGNSPDRCCIRARD
jgi:hypothetical protein